MAQYEKNEREAATATKITDDDIKRSQEFAAKNKRRRGAFALVKSLDKVTDPAGRALIFDKIIDTYGEDKEMDLIRCVAWAMYKKADEATDTAEKKRLYAEVVERYSTVRDKKVGEYVRWTLGQLLKSIENGDEKIAVCDRILNKHGDRLPDMLAVRLLDAKADSLRNKDQIIAVYDTIMSRFLSSREDGAYDQAIIAAMDKMNLIDDEQEQLRLCDIAINAFLKTPQRTRYYLFERAVEKKAQLVGDPSLKLTLFNQVITDNVTEEAVVQARSMRQRLLNTDAERLADCEEFIVAHQASKSDFVQMMVARAMARKADLLTDSEAKAAAYRAVIEKCATIEDSRAKELSNQTVKKLANLSGDTEFAAKHFDEEAAKAEKPLDVIRALRSKAGVVDDVAEKTRLYDEIIALADANPDTLESREAISAILQKVRLTDDNAEKIQLYDSIIARGKDSTDRRQRVSAAEALLEKGRLVEDKEAKIAIFDTIIARGMGGGDKEWLESAAEATLEKAKLIDDKEEKIRLYDSVVFDISQFRGRYFVSNGFKERVALATSAEEKARLYDRYIAAVGTGLDSDDRISLLLDKAEALSVPTDKAKQYDEVIELCERYLNAPDEGGRPFLRTYERNSVMNNFGKAILGRADLAENAEEKMQLYDKFLAFPVMGRPGFREDSFEKILSRKAELSGGSSVKNDYFDDKIRSAANDSERINWYARKAAGAELSERVAIEEEMITKFFDSTEKEVEGTVARLLARKFLGTSDPFEKNELSDRLIERYKDSGNDYAMYASIMAYKNKAEAAENDEAKLEIYNTVIERYKDKRDPMVKDMVDGIIAAKFRLEAKTQ